MIFVIFFTLVNFIYLMAIDRVFEVLLIIFEEVESNGFGVFTEPVCEFVMDFSHLET